jgi:Ca2+-binding RTX toxin-like protein
MNPPRSPNCGRLATVLVAALLLAATAAAPATAATCGGEEVRIVGDTYYGTECDDTYRAPRDVTRIYGEGGNDTLYGQRGNDFLFGGPGNDRLYGGIGDDQVRGGPGDDLLSGGFGADSALDGEEGDDFIRGDATIDRILNTGGGIDTLSYATGVTPGFFDRPNPPYSFPDFSAYEDFPTSPAGRGAYINLGTGRGDNGRAPDGGGFDEEVAGSAFDVVIGTPFADYIVGTDEAQTIYGGGGADVILGEGGGDQIYGGADGDFCSPDEATLHDCESSSEKKVAPRDAGKVSVGEMAPQSGNPPALYLSGSDGNDTVSVSYSPEASHVTFALSSGPGFDATSTQEGGCEAVNATSAVRPAARPPDSIVAAGLAGDDSIVASGFPESTSVVLLGGEGVDHLTGGDTEDALVDGSGDDEVHAGGGDDALSNNEGADKLYAEAGEDLFVSDAVCDGDLLDGGPDRDNANWANFKEAVSIDMAAKKAGLVGPGGGPRCPSAPLLTGLEAIEDVEGTNGDDTLTGDSGENQLLGRPGHDSYFAAGGNDSILANSGDEDRVIDCGEGFDTAQVDHPEYHDPAPIDCEAIHERDPNSFRPPDTPPNPNPAPEATASQATQPVVPKGPPKDRTPPGTRFLRRPAKFVYSRTGRRKVSFAFASTEAGSSFRCKLDRGPFKPCRSPRSYRLALGVHTFRVLAIDTAGNRDRTPALFKLRVASRG